MEIIETYSHIIGPLVTFIVLTITIAGISICKEIYNINIFKALGITSGSKIPKTIYLGRVGGVGDILLISPSVAALKNKFPQAKITFGTAKGIFHDIIANDPNIDKFDFPVHPFDWPRTKSFGKYLARKCSYIKQCFIYNLKYDLVIFFHDDGRYLKPGTHMVDHYAKIAGLVLKQRRPRVYLNEEDESQAKVLLINAGIKENEKFIVLAPENGGKKYDHRSWPHFSELIRKIHENHKIKILTLLPKSSKDCPAGTIRIVDEPTIRAGAAIIKQCSLFIGLDCGLTHIASTFDVEIISIHIGYPIELYGAISPHVNFVSNAPFLFPGNNKEREKKPLSVDRVFEQVEKALNFL